VSEDYDWYEPEDRDATCERCGADGLFWRQVGAAWRLYEHRPHGSIAEHRCNYKNHFEDLA